jgi:hypothetical protein
MEIDRLMPLFFVIYCTTVGIVLTVIPWTPGWSQMLLHLPAAAGGFLGHSVVRGGLTGFGLVHLVWGIHDLQAILRSPDEIGQR